MPLLICFSHRTSPVSVTAVLESEGWDPALLAKNPALDTAEVIWELAGQGAILWRRCTFELRPSDLSPYLRALEALSQRLLRG